ncbi:MAG: nucleotidyltransferase domain-containing protein [Bacteroidetes bacterium]|nr:MAG: nucleotidyltransferase domain-containing protein [Bacteroidota bacterium]
MDKEYAIKITKDYINRLLLNKINLQSAYLFGSFAKGNNHKDSDIDLAIVLDKVINMFETEINLMTLRKNDETVIEPHIFEKSDFVKVNPFINEILNTGIQIKIR